MNSKLNLDFGSVALDVATTIDDAVSRSEAFQKKKLQQSQQQLATKSTSRAGGSPSEVTLPPDSRPPRRQRQRPPATRTDRDQVAAQRSDPWVNTTFKVRNSKKERLHRLHLERQLAGLTPYSKQDFLDEALDYLLGKYEASPKRVIAEAK